MKLTIYYSVINGGDGSAYPNFWESKELAEWDEEHDTECWAESSVGDISFESESFISCLTEITTKELYLIEHYFDDYDPDENEQQEFIEKFFPNGLPIFIVKLEEIETRPSDYKYIYNNIYVDKKKIGKIFKEREKSGKIFEDFLNKIREDISV